MSYPQRSEILDWVSDRSALVDTAIATGVRNAIEELDEWPAFEWQASLNELLKLSKKQDAFYDRPTIGPAYALWYHARRVNPLVSQLERLMRTTVDRGHQTLDVVDLGSGTGATAWAAALVAAAVADLRGMPPRVIVHEVESSPFMSSTALSLWTALTEELDHFGAVQRFVRSESWPNARLSSNNPTFVLASFLLDHTDKNYVDQMAQSLHGVIDNCSADGVIFTVSKQKRVVADTAVDVLETTHGWTGQLRQASPVWEGDMPEVTKVRRQLYEGLGLSSSMTQRPVSFVGDNPSVREAIRPEGNQSELFQTEPWMRLSADQQAIVDQPLDRSIFCCGSAGSGKSVVLVERLARLVMRARVGKARHVLVTSFNKDMIAQVDQWLEERLNHDGLSFSRSKASEGNITYESVGAGNDTIRLLNWDKAPTQLAKVSLGSDSSESKWVNDAERVLHTLRKTPEVSVPDRVDGKFLLAEYRRVIFGLGAITADAYIGNAKQRGVERSGRGQGLGTGHRRAIWKAYEELGDTMFTGRRIEMLRRIRSGQLKAKYSDVFVDEVQDFSPADIECVLGLHNGQGSAFYVGDEAQALFVGTSYSRPKPPQGDWRAGHLARLEGSHRLPVPIARCVAGVAQRALEIKEGLGLSGEDIGIPESRKAAVIGARPLLIVGELQDLAAKIQLIQRTYRTYLMAEAGSDRVTILEPDRALKNALPDAETSTVKKIKGLERGLVVWSSRIAPDVETEALEVAYTAMTRASCLLIIAVDPSELPHSNRQVLQALDGGYLSPWDSEAQRWWNKFQGTKGN